jgi:HAE1 family hydrophobic/amphiphilic exporter-1
MGLTRVSLIRPVAITMVFLALAAMGLVAYTRLPVERFPNISFPSVGVSVSYPGASPEDVEALVTKPLEDAVIGVNGIDTIESTSIQGSSRVQIRFVEGMDVNAAAIDIGRKVNEVRRKLPTGVSDPSITKADVSASPIMNVAISSDTLDMQTLTTLVTDQIEPVVQSVNGVAAVTVVGGLTRQIQVRANPDKLRAYGLSLAQIQSAIANQNVSQPGGTVRTPGSVYNTRTQAQAQKAEDLNSLMIVPRGGTTTNGVFLKDVAQVIDTPAFQSSFQRLNGNASIGLVISQQTGVNGLAVADGIHAVLDQLQGSFGQQSGVHFNIVNDQSIFTRAAVDDVQRNLCLAILLTAAVLLVFLHTIRNTLMVLVAIPFSLVSTFLVMFAFGFNLDTMSLMALALLIGILVDDSIVVLENINRHLALGKNPWNAALDGRSEIGLAAIAITLTDVVVYAPVAFMSGNIGQLFREFGLTIVAATLFSLLVSFTLTPMLASRLLKSEALHTITGRGPWAAVTRAWERGFDRLLIGYRWLLGHTLNVRWLPMLVGFGMLGVVIAFIPLHIVGTEFVPLEDDNQFNVQIQMPVGTSVEVTSAAMKQVEQRLSALPEVQSVFSSVGGGGFGAAQEQNGSITVGLVDKSQRTRTVFDILPQVRRMGAGIPDLTIRTGVPSPLVGGGGPPIEVRVTGTDFTQLIAISNQVLDIVNRTPGTIEARTTTIIPSPEYRAIVDRAKAADYGVTAQTVADTLNAAIQGVLVSELRPEGQNQVDIVLQLAGAERLTPEQLGSIPVQTAAGDLIRLDQVSTIVPSSSAGQISRFNRARGIEIQANVNGRSVGDVLRDVQAQTSQIPLPVGYTILQTGQGSQLAIAFGALIQALTLSIILMYMLMAALYESFIYPFAVIFCLPVALVGAFLGLLAVGDTINIFSMIGMIMLVGLVAKNAILLVDYTNTLRAQGMSRRQALLEAGPARLRPILMTTITLLFAMIPLALKLGSGAEARSPMAIVVIGGMITSTLLTLVLVPCAYTYLDDLQNLILRRRAPSVTAADLPLEKLDGLPVAVIATGHARLSSLRTLVGGGTTTAVRDDPS